MKVCSIIFLFILLLFIPCHGDDSSEAEVIDTIVIRDTILFDNQVVLENITPVTNPVIMENILTQKPTVALFKSMFIPGWGQLGNRRSIKAVFFLALDGWMVLSAMYYGNQASDFRKQYEAITDPALLSQKKDRYSLYLDRKDERNKFTWFAVIVTFFSMFDAYVDAHLSGYPDKENLDRVKIGLEADEFYSPKVTLSYNF